MKDESEKEYLGKLVRLAWIEWAKEQPNPKPSWLVPWEDLPEHYKEADRRIGEFIQRELLRQLDDARLEGERTPGQVAYEAYIRSRGLSRKWSLLPEIRRLNWEAAAQAVLQQSEPCLGCGRHKACPAHVYCNPSHPEWGKASDERLKELKIEQEMQREVLAPTTGVSLIAAERERQVTQEGWTPEHDDGHGLGEMALAAACYAATPRERPLVWPWDSKWWKPTPNDRIRELTKAGALIAAEIDRLLRAKGKEREIGQ